MTYAYALTNGKTLNVNLCFGIAVSAENFPDENFRSYVNEKIDTTDDDVLTAEEIAAVTTIDVNDRGISDLTGIGYFTALTTLYCYNNQLTSLDVSKNTKLTVLHCENNPLWKLDLPEDYSGGLYYPSERAIVVADETYDLSAYGLDAENFSGGTLDENGILTPDAFPGQ